MTDDEDGLRFAQIVDTAEGLDSLIRDKPAFWEWAAFGSALLQRKAELQSEIHKHRVGYAPPSGKRISDVGALYALVEETKSEVERRAHNMDCYLRSPAFTSALRTDSDPDCVTGAAITVMEFYADHLRLAQRVRGVSAPDRFADVIEDTAHLVDRSLGGVDQFIAELVGTVDVLPTLALASAGEPLFHEIPFNLHMDNALLARILAGLERLRGRYLSASRWALIACIARTPLGERLGRKLFD